MGPATGQSDSPTASAEVKRGRGRPRLGDGETVAVLVRVPPLLDAAARRDAERADVDLAEWWRRAARVYLGWDEVPGDTQRQYAEATELLRRAGK